MNRNWILLCAVVLCCSDMASLMGAEVMISVVDTATDAAVPCRVHLKDSAGEAVLSDALPSYRDHFVCPGTATLDLPTGEYTYEVERGPEYVAATGMFTVVDGAKNDVALSIARITDMAAAGWWSGELHVHRDVKDIELLMQAEDLHVAPVITWWNDRNLWKDQAIPDQLLVRFDGNRFYHLMAGEDEREGGALLYFNLGQPLEIIGATREFPSPMAFLQSARRQQQVWVDIEKPFWWDVPIWLASGQVDSIGLANNHMCRSRMYEDEAWGKPRDDTRLPAPRGNGLWTQELYYKILNTGLRIPPSAGSASGVLPNPVGYNRVYVQLDGALTYDAWWEGLRDGRSFVTNGPLLKVTANGKLPGHVFKAKANGRLDINIVADITGRDEIDVIEVIQNGEVVQSITPNAQSYSGELPAITFDRSGWFLVRVRCKTPRTFRFASTAPYYVEIGDEQQRVSKSAAQFFVDWVDERTARVKLTDPQMRREVLKHHKTARNFWQGRVRSANAE